jgi:hypothetical protein
MIYIGKKQTLEDIELKVNLAIKNDDLYMRSLALYRV